MKIAIWGASYAAKYTLDILERAGEHEVAFLFDPTKPGGGSLYGYPVHGEGVRFAALAKKHGVGGGVVAVGDNWIRSLESERILQEVPGFRFVNAIHPSVVLGKCARIGDGVVMMAGAIVNNDTIVGDGCFLATGASLDHDSSMRRFSSLSAQSTVGGRVTIGAFSCIALGASVVSGVRIGEHSVVGAGAVVLQDLPDRVTAYGVPARVVAHREIGEPYLHERGARSNLCEGDTAEGRD